MAGVDMEVVLDKSFELLEKLAEAEDDSKQKEIIQEHLRELDKTDLPSPPPFEEGWEWFNVSEPLSLERHLRGKVVVLDFFTYCCINCMHILPDLHQLEHKYSHQDGLVIVGVHSAKFDNEKVSANILSAVHRYDITHPVVNDSKASLWFQMQIQCWPTLVVLSPQGKILLLLMGEGQMATLSRFVQEALEHYGSKGEISGDSIGIELSKAALSGSPLLFPGKVAVDESGSRLAIADTGHHRVIITDTSGIVKHVIGSGSLGFSDGSFSEAQFSSPQGVVWREDTVYVADTENHAVRQIDLHKKEVITLTGTGSQGHDLEGGKSGTQQEISSPWDIALGKSVGSSETDMLYIAMAGTHQIWLYFLKDGKWLKNKSYSAGTCVRFAGSGREEIRNNNYPHAAAFAQPSGIVLGEDGLLYLADSESSSIRTVSTIDGAVRGLVGASKDPRNLFAFGDVDGVGYDAKLQHPLGVAYHKQADTAKLYVADSYNHKVKCVDVGSKQCVSVLGSGEAGDCLADDLHQVQLNEPGGLCVDRQNNILYIADTNNHAIKVYDLNTQKLTQLPIIFADEADVDDVDSNHNFSMETTDTDTKTSTLKRAESKRPVKVPQEVLQLGPGAKVTLQLALRLADCLHLTQEAPSSWQIFTIDDSLDSVLLPSLSQTEGTLYDLDNQPAVHIMLPGDVQEVTSDLLLECRVFYCGEDGACRMKTVMFQQPLHITPDTPGDTNSTVIRQLTHKLDI